MIISTERTWMACFDCWRSSKLSASYKASSCRSIVSLDSICAINSRSRFRHSWGPAWHGLQQNHKHNLLHNAVRWVAVLCTICCVTLLCFALNRSLDSNLWHHGFSAAVAKIHVLCLFCFIYKTTEKGKCKFCLQFCYHRYHLQLTDPGVQAVSPQVTISHPPGGRLPLLSARPAVTFPATEHYRPLAGTKLYCSVTEAHRYKQLAQGCYAALPRVGFEPTTCWSQIQSPTPCTTSLPVLYMHTYKCALLYV